MEPQPESRLPRRTIIAGAATVAASLAGTRLAHGAALTRAAGVLGNISVRIASGMLGTANLSARAYDALRIAYEAANPGYTVKFLTGPATVGGPLPDVMIDVPGIGSEMDLMPWVRASNLDLGAFLSGTVEALKSTNGNLEGLPFDPAPAVILYDHAALAAVKALPPKAGWTMDDFLSVLQRIYKADPHRLPLAMSESLAQPLYALFRGYGAEPYDLHGKVNFAQKPAVDMMAHVACPLATYATNSLRTSYVGSPVCYYVPLRGAFPMQHVPKGYAVTRFPIMPHGGTPGELFSIMLRPHEPRASQAWTIAHWLVEAKAQPALLDLGYTSALTAFRSNARWWMELPPSVKEAWSEPIFTPGPLGATDFTQEWTTAVWSACGVASSLADLTRRLREWTLCYNAPPGSSSPACPTV